MTYVFYLFAALLIYLSYKSFRGGIDYLSYFKQELAKPPTVYAPMATIFVPCRGVDNGMLENLDALLSQNYPEYEIVFIVDEEHDPAAALIETAWREAKRAVKLVVAPKATDSSQKVTNLREGIGYADPQSEVFVFADSDARPARNWLRCLVSSLADEKVGAATGYRWFISETETFASEMRNMWNASIASALGPNKKSNFCWGGSTAIKREVFERLDIREKWRGTLSDDFTMTRIIEQAGIDIHFVPRALNASVEDCSLRELVEFSTRQMKITRVYAPKLWMMAFFGSGLFCVTMLTALLIVMFSKRNDVAVAAALFTITAVTFFSIGKSWLRLKAVSLALIEHRAKLRRQFVPQVTLWPLAQALFFFNSFAALISRRLSWRGTTYEMVSSYETLVLQQRSGKK